MLDTLIASIVATAIGAAGLALMMRASERRWQKMSADFTARLEAQDAEFRARPRPAPISLDVPKWEPSVPDPRASEEHLERILARLDATAASGATDDEDVSPVPPEVPIDLGDLAHRLSNAGYDGGPLRLTGVEVRPDRHVVVHLEPHGP